MCVQDMKIAQRGTLRVANFTPAAGPFQIPDVSRALWFSVVDNVGNAATVLTTNSNVQGQELPRDTQMARVGGTLAYMSRQQCGSLFNGPLFIIAAGAVQYFFMAFDMDPDSWSAIQGSVLE